MWTTRPWASSSPAPRSFADFITRPHHFATRSSPPSLPSPSPIAMPEPTFAAHPLAPGRIGVRGLNVLSPHSVNLIVMVAVASFLARANVVVQTLRSGIAAWCPEAGPPRPPLGEGPCPAGGQGLWFSREPLPTPE